MVKKKIEWVIFRYDFDGEFSLGVENITLIRLKEALEHEEFSKFESEFNGDDYYGDDYYGYDSSLIVYGEREETDDELNERLEKYRIKSEKQKISRENGKKLVDKVEREEYERLKKKYG